MWRCADAGLSPQSVHYLLWNLLDSGNGDLLHLRPFGSGACGLDQNPLQEEDTGRDNFSP